MGRYRVVKPETKEFYYRYEMLDYSFIFYFSSLFNKSRFEDRILKKLDKELLIILNKLKLDDNIIVFIIKVLLLSKYYKEIEKDECYIETIIKWTTERFKTYNIIKFYGMFIK